MNLKCFKPKIFSFFLCIALLAFFPVSPVFARGGGSAIAAGVVGGIVGSYTGLKARQRSGELLRATVVGQANLLVMRTFNKAVKFMSEKGTLFPDAMKIQETMRQSPTSWYNSKIARNLSPDSHNGLEKQIALMLAGMRSVGGSDILETPEILASVNKPAAAIMETVAPGTSIKPVSVSQYRENIYGNREEQLSCLETCLKDPVTWLTLPFLLCGFVFIIWAWITDGGRKPICQRPQKKKKLISRA